MHKVFILLGGNIGDRLQYLSMAKKLLQEKAGRIILESSIYETEAWGFEDSKLFLNMVLCLESDFGQEELLLITQQIELDLGRKNKGGEYSARTIDIDILFYDDTVYNSPQLTIPHKNIQNRKFELIPMAEIAPDFIHPVLEKSMMHLLAICPDNLNVRKL